MATWQFDIQLVPAGQALKRQLDGSLEAQLLPFAHRSKAMGLLDELDLPSSPMTPGWLVYGDEDGNRVDLLATEDGLTEVSARIDTRVESDWWCEVVIDLAKALDCELLIAEAGCVIPADKDALVSALMHSPAWRFALDPRAFLRGLA
jgi:hypothetical protein